MGRIRLLFLDLAGVLRGTEIPYQEDKEVHSTFFDASSVYGFEEIENSDLELRLPRERVKRLPWNEKWYAGISSIHYPSGERYVKDPRLVAEKTSEYLKDLGYEARLGVEMELFFFHDVSMDLDPYNQSLTISAPEVQGESGLIPPKRGYHLVEPVDEVAELREKTIETMEQLGFRIAKSHHEVATAGQVEITGGPYGLVEAGDFVAWFKYAVRYVAMDNGYVAVLLPKPLSGDNGSGMHIHSSLWSGGKNLFYDPDDKYGLSETARYFIGGLMEHGRSLSAIVSPTVNSYRRLIPGYEAPTILAWDVGNRSVAIRIPATRNPKHFRVEYRPPDPLANPYLAIPAIILAGLDGIRKKLDPGEPLNYNAYKLSEEELKRRGYKQLPRSLDEALDELESDHEYLEPVFSKELIDSYIELKRKESRELQAIPTPSEYAHYIYW